MWAGKYTMLVLCSSPLKSIGLSACLGAAFNIDFPRPRGGIAPASRRKTHAKEAGPHHPPPPILPCTLPSFPGKGFW